MTRPVESPAAAPPPAASSPASPPVTPAPLRVRSTCKMTVEQYLQLGEDPVGVRLELVDGEIAVSPSPQNPHVHAVGRLYKVLVNHIDDHGLGYLMQDADVRVSDFTVRRPDLSYYTRNRMHLAGQAYPIGVPDLAVEVISPTSVQIDRRDKFEQYAEGGIGFYWLVDPQRKTLEAFTLKDGAYELSAEASGEQRLNAPPFPELTIELGRLWWPPR